MYWYIMLQLLDNCGRHSVHGTLRKSRNLRQSQAPGPPPARTGAVRTPEDGTGEDGHQVCSALSRSHRWCVVHSDTPDYTEWCLEAAGFTSLGNLLKKPAVFVNFHFLVWYVIFKIRYHHNNLHVNILCQNLPFVSIALFYRYINK